MIPLRHLFAVGAAAILLAGCARRGTVSSPRSSSGEIPRMANESDWPQWGRSASKNRVSPATGLPFDFSVGELKENGKDVDMATTRNVRWVANMGSFTYGNPTVADGRVYVGTNNEGRGDPRFKGDHSILKCLDAKTGEEIWTLTVPKLGGGKVNDWEYLGICSPATIVGDRVYVLTNRCEVMALDVHGLANGNQGFQDEGHYMAYAGDYIGPTSVPPVPLKEKDADIIWIFDMREELGVFPHNITSSGILAVGDILYCSTSNGVTYDHTDTPAPKAPCLVALNRKIAERPGATPREILVGEEGSGLSKRIFHCNWTSPCWGVRGGKGVVIFGGPDGRLYCFDPKAVPDEDGFGIFPEIWRHDCNPPTYRYENGDKNKPLKYAVGGKGPSEIIATPVYHEGRVYAAIGQDPEHDTGYGNFSCVDIETGEAIWETRIDRSLSSAAIHGGRVYGADLSGRIYSFDAETGKIRWQFDTMGLIWSSPLVADGKLYIGNDGGELYMMSLEKMASLVAAHGMELKMRFRQKNLDIELPDKTRKRLTPGEAAEYIRRVDFQTSISSSAIVADGTLYVATHTRLYAISEGGR